MKFLGAFSAVVLTAFAGAQTYTAIVLQPPSSFAYLYGSGAGSTRHGGIGALPNESATRAILFTEKSFLDVTPGNALGALINDSDADRHVGASVNSQGYPMFAYFWQGSVPINLHPAGYNGTSEALGVGDNQQVGYVFSGFYCSECGRVVQRHAALWTGSAASFTKLHSRIHDYSEAEGTDGKQQVGQGQVISTGYFHALLWNGPGSFAVDLHPSGNYDTSKASAVDSEQQVGFVSGEATDWNGHAALWKGSAGSFVDLNPPSFYQSVARSVRKGVQVGASSTWAETWKYRAMLWRGNAGSFVDLHALLPAQYQSWDSSADDIDASGNIVGFVNQGGEWLPVIWKVGPKKALH